MLRFISNLLFAKTMADDPKKEPPITIYSKRHLFLLNGANYEEEALLFLNKIRALSVDTGLIRVDDAFHEEYNKNFDRYSFGIRQRIESAISRESSLIIVGMINGTDEVGNRNPTLVDLLSGVGKELRAEVKRFTFKEPVQYFLERQRKRTAKNKWPFTDENYLNWYDLTRKGPSDIEIDSSKSPEHTAGQMFRYVPLPKNK